MTKRRKLTIKNIEKVPINERALRKFILHYYKGKNNIFINFDNRISAWGQHIYESTQRTHYITISPIWSMFEQKTWLNRKFDEGITEQDIIKLNDFDIMCRIICTILHELKHAMQCDRNPIRYAKCQDDKHPAIRNSHMKYKLSELEAEAEGWALLNFNRALWRYERWCNEGPES